MRQQPSGEIRGQLPAIDIDTLATVYRGVADGYNFVRECLPGTQRPNQVILKGGARRNGFGKESLGYYLSYPQPVSDPSAACPTQ